MRWDNRKVNDILSLIISGEVKYVIIFDISRLGRYSPETIGFFAMCLKMGAVIVTPERTYDWSMESIVVFVINAVGDHTSNVNRAKASKQARERRFQLGFYNKRIPFGYRRSKKDELD
jgi:DNA invertase Pin-like site-specific DNA recombinase